MSEEVTQPTPGFDVGYVAHLARLHLDDQEKAKLQGQLEHILTYVEELKKVDVTGVTPMATSMTDARPLRPDQLQPSLDHDRVMDNAPAARHGQFLVPRILE
jgi:aspartyl-tRNA(Asn)/glutamyl-tRNA(Gln) amidotransferase subunit C